MSVIDLIDRFECEFFSVVKSTEREKRRNVMRNEIEVRREKSWQSVSNDNRDSRAE